MERRMKFLTLFLFCLAMNAHAEPVSDIKLKVKVKSVKGEWVKALYAGKPVNLPKEVVPNTATNKEQTITLNPTQYKAMKLSYFLAQP